MSTRNLTRAEAHDLIEDIDDRRLLAVAWDVPGHWNDSADWNSEQSLESLHEFADQAADGDAARARGPRDSDRTGLRAP